MYEHPLYCEDLPIPTDSYWMLDLYYKEESDWRPMPAWATFLYKLGHAVACADTPVTVVVLTPECGGTLPFVALGSIAGMWATDDEQACSLDEHWDMLARLHPGTPVSYSVLRDNNRVLRHARLRLERMRPNGELELKFRTSASQVKAGLGANTATVRRNEEARRVAPIHTQAAAFTPDIKAKEYHVSPVLGKLIGSRIHDFVSVGSPDCLLLGNETRLRSECGLLLGGADGTALGTIGEGLGLHSDNGGTWHTRVCPLRGHTPSGEPYRLVVFDGPSAWLRHRTDYPQASHVVLAAHTSQALPELLSEVKGTFREGAAPLNLRERVPPLPQGMEVISFMRTDD